MGTRHATTLAKSWRAMSRAFGRGGESGDWLIGRANYRRHLQRRLASYNLDNRLAQWISGRDSNKVIPVETWVGRSVFYLVMIFVLIGFFEALGL